MATRKRKTSKKSYVANEYMFDNTAKLLQQVSEEAWEEERLPKPQEEKKKKVKRHIRVHADQAIDFKSLVFLTTALIVVAFLTIDYLQIRSGITEMERRISSLESQLVSITSLNDAAYEKIEASIDLSYIYQAATQKLGMVHANKNQVIPYESTKSDFIRQYGEIPDVEEHKSLSDLLPK